MITTCVASAASPSSSERVPGLDSASSSPSSHSTILNKTHESGSISLQQRKFSTLSSRTGTTRFKVIHHQVSSPTTTSPQSPSSHNMNHHFYLFNHDQISNTTTTSPTLTSSSITNLSQTPPQQQGVITTPSSPNTTSPPPTRIRSISNSSEIPLVQKVSKSKSLSRPPLPQHFTSQTPILPSSMTASSNNTTNTTSRSLSTNLCTLNSTNNNTQDSSSEHVEHSNNIPNHKSNTLGRNNNKIIQLLKQEEERMASNNKSELDPEEKKKAMFDKRRSRAIFRSNAENPNETFDFSQLDEHFRAISQSSSISDQPANASRCYPVRQETLTPPSDSSDNTQKCLRSAKIDTQEKRMANINNHTSSLYDSCDYDSEFSTSSSCYSPIVAIHRHGDAMFPQRPIQRNFDKLLNGDAYASPSSSDYAASDVAVVDENEEEDYDDDPFHDFEEYDDEDDECVYGDFEEYDDDSKPTFVRTVVSLDDRPTSPLVIMQHSEQEDLQFGDEILERRRRVSTRNNPELKLSFSRARSGSCSAPSEDTCRILSEIHSKQELSELVSHLSPNNSTSTTTTNLALSPLHAASLVSSPGKSPRGVGSPLLMRRPSQRSIAGGRRKSKAISYTVTSIMADEQLKEIFFQFLTEIHNTELVTFLQEEESFRLGCINAVVNDVPSLLMEYETALQKASKIFEKYIKVGSIQELNLSSETRNNMQQRMESLLTPCERNKGVNGRLQLSEWISSNIFEIVTTEVNISLKNHIIPLFLESSSFENYLLRKHVQENTVSNLRGKNKVQRMLGFYIPENAKDNIIVNGATVAIGGNASNKKQPPPPTPNKQPTVKASFPSSTSDPFDNSSMNERNSKKKKSFTALFAQQSSVGTAADVESDLSFDQSPFKPQPTQAHSQSLNKFKNWILGKKSHPNGATNANDSTKLSTNPTASLSSPNLKSLNDTSPPNSNKKSSTPSIPHIPSSINMTPEISSLLNDGIVFIKVHTKRRGNIRILEINIDKMSMLSEQDKNLALELKNLLVTHVDASNPFDKNPHLREFLQTKISVQAQKNWEEINEDCIIKVKSPASSNFYKL
ncbi:hypothetical protein C9374_001580 [Naegleria lovaniensis]|uniref:RGS domain-containing protein n=1 Tax=Naegleria lovaniensis TaxID=51637 RepID=A0AA88KM38_NAELO|nr:uncharacterized protein C9374_001580 [Naegleria lovaniensis]KAG2387248.1 hypothetical protein C9374_001580 [Naegleria lovaniensis]